MTPFVDSRLSHQPNVTEPCALILTNSSDATSDYLCQRLIDGGIRCCRFDTDTALDTLRISCDHGDELWHWDGGRVERGTVAAVVLRRPKPVTPSIAGDPFQVRHAAGEWSECIEGLLAGIAPDRWINHPACNAAASHKIEQLRHAQEVGLLVPDWIVTTARLHARDPGDHCVGKPRPRLGGSTRSVGQDGVRDDGLGCTGFRPSRRARRVARPPRILRGIVRREGRALARTAERERSGRTRRWASSM